MYGFVENWILNTIGVDGEPYYLSEDVRCSIVDKETFKNIQKSFTFISNDGSNDHIPFVINSNVTGMKVLLMKYWVDETILYSLTDGDIKNSEPYVNFMKMVQPRFNYDYIKEKLSIVYNEIISNPNSPFENDEDNSDDNIIENNILETPVRIENISIIEEKKVEEIAPQAEDENKKEGEIFIEKIIKLYMYEEVRIVSTPKGYKILITIDVPKRIVDKLIEFSDAINKNVVFTRYYYPKIFNHLKKLDPIEIYKHTVIFDLQPGQQNNNTMFVNQTHLASGYRNIYTNAICLGEKLNKHWIVKGSCVNSEISEINENPALTKKERENKIEELINNKVNSPFFRYDCIFKDTYTSIVFALKQRCIIYLLFDYNNECITLLDKCFIEIARRINMNIPYENLLEIDKIYFDTLESNNMEDYINFAIESSKQSFNEFANQLLKEKERFKSYMDSAMESAKKVRNLQDMIDSFNMGEFEAKQKEKSKITYLDTLKIKEVSSIYIEGESIHVFTKNLYVKDIRTKKWHDIGTFHIIIGMLSSVYDANNTVRIFNTKHLGMGMDSGFQAPHVWEDGHACHGNLITGMTEAYKNRNLFDLVYQIILFLQSANTSDSAGQYIDSWPIVTEEEALGKVEPRDITFIYDKKNEIEEKFDSILADALPINITR